MKGPLDRSPAPALLVAAPAAAFAPDEPAAWLVLALACALSGPFVRMRRERASGDAVAGLAVVALASFAQMLLDAAWPGSCARHGGALLVLATLLVRSAPARPRPAVTPREALSLALALAALRALVWLAHPGVAPAGLAGALPLSLFLHPGGVVLAAGVLALAARRGEAR